MIHINFDKKHEKTISTTPKPTTKTKTNRTNKKKIIHQEKQQMKLNNNHEIIGVLSEITQNKEHITLTFLIKHHITLPQNKTKKLNLQKLKGKQIDEHQKLIIELAQQYYEDAKYYFEKKDYFTAFGCINYAHGLIDAYLKQ